MREPFYAPSLYFTHECPDLFKMGDWWYLLFSEFTDLVRTRYRMSHSLSGAGSFRKEMILTAMLFMRQKQPLTGISVSFLAGIHPRTDGKDNGTWNRDGNLVVHEIQQEKNGELAVRVPQTVSNAFSNKVNYSFENGIENVQVENGAVTLQAAGTFASALAGKMPGTCKINATIQFEKNTKECGLMLRCRDDMEMGYYIRLEPKENRLVFDMWPRDRSKIFNMIELSRDID